MTQTIAHEIEITNIDSSKAAFLQFDQSRTFTDLTGSLKI